MPSFSFDPSSSLNTAQIQSTVVSSSGHQPAASSPMDDELAGTRLAMPSSLEIPRIERFVGDLNPEAVIREQLASGATHLRDRVGLWINTPVPQDREGNERDTFDTANSRAGYSAKHALENPSVTSLLHQRYSSALKACQRLPCSTLAHLIPIYFSRVNHILPLVDQGSFLPAFRKGATSVFLERAVCLIAAKDKAASAHLHLVPDGPSITARQFCSEIYAGLVSAMDAGLEVDRFTRIRVLALMSLHSEGYEGAEVASMHLCQAIHQAQTVGLHLERPDRLEGDPLTTLFWSLWTLDKMHACIGGRPILLADRDIGIKRPDLKARRSRSAFEVWFALSDLLSRVISLYRPFADLTIAWETDYPAFEEIIGDPHAQEELDASTLGGLELYYYAVSILSCRSQLSHRPDDSKPSYARQGLAAVRIYSLVATECSGNLPPLPIVPYAVALSMGVSYQQFRSSRLITHFDRAKASLEASCDLLEELGVYWYSAEAMARLGRKALRHIQGITLKGQGSRPSSGANDDDHDDGEHNNSNATRQENQRPSIANVPVSSYDSNSHHHHHRIMSDVPHAAAIPEHEAPLPVDRHQSDIQDPDRSHGFANIDTLFDDFLDLSLPTNFWDPVFFPADDSV
ncbi:hypothetical protein ARAM_001959 [Aspergillus rambellii]|uniref:Xylanolytic transcriptional activator regulatory domain-containing protein n=1 Tax=Aspergillus rambellii TaxID=308745 RepID=A0A0F8UY33_9EURO|nr:hypothetical protein ARAM_001959 [Aspergillus rambellii]